MEYKDINTETSNKRTDDINSCEEEISDFEALFKSLSTNFNKGNKDGLVMDCKRFHSSLNNTNDVPIEFFNNCKVVELFTIILSSEGYEIAYKDIVKSLTKLITYVDLDIRILNSPECLFLFDGRVFPIIDDIFVCFSFFASLLRQNPDAAFNFFVCNLFKKIFDITFSTDDLKVRDYGICVLNNTLLSIRDKINIMNDEMNSTDLNDVLHYEIEICSFIINESRKENFFTINLLQTVLICLTGNKIIQKKMMEEFNKRIVFESFAQNCYDIEILVLKILSTLIKLQDPELMQKWDLSDLFDVIDTKRDKTVQNFCHLLSVVCKTYLSFSKYLIESGEVKHFLFFISEGTFIVKESALSVIEAILEHRTIEWIIYLIESDFISLIGDFIDIESGSFLIECIKILTNFASFAADSCVTEEIIEYFEANEIEEKLSNIEEESTDSDTKIQIECFFNIFQQIIH